MLGDTSLREDLVPVLAVHGRRLAIRQEDMVPLGDNLIVDVKRSAVVERAAAFVEQLHDRLATVQDDHVAAEELERHDISVLLAEFEKVEVCVSWRNGVQVAEDGYGGWTRREASVAFANLQEAVDANC